MDPYDAGISITEHVSNSLWFDFNTILESNHRGMINRCDKVLSEFNLLYSVSIGNENVIQQASKFSESLHQRVIEAEYGLKSRLEKLENRTKENESDVMQMEQAIEKYAENMTLTLQCAVISELCQLNKRFLKMETAALGTN